MLLANDPRVTSTLLRNTTLVNVLGWATVVLVTLADLTLLGSQALGLFGITVFG